MRGNKRRSRRGFTLMEVLLVLAIIVIMGSMVTYYFVGIQRSSNVKLTQSQISSFEDMLNVYRIEVGTFPDTSQGLQALRTMPANLANPSRWVQVAEKDIPPDPWGNPYQYELLGSEQYRIWSFGPDGIDGTEDDISNL